jgi:DNA mismatch repair ATPase MutL
MQPAQTQPAQSLEQRPLQAIRIQELYLAVEVPEGLLVIDQHALHERILFEQLKDRLASGTLEVERLLIPEPVEFTPRQAALAELGLQVEAFGCSTLFLSSYPSILSKRCRRRSCGRWWTTWPRGRRRRTGSNCSTTCSA